MKKEGKFSSGRYCVVNRGKPSFSVKSVLVKSSGGAISLNGAVGSTGTVSQPFQWSSEYHDPELSLTYYNFRHYNPTDGRWLTRDIASRTTEKNLYCFVKSNPAIYSDGLGLDVWTENGSSAFMMHKRICVETKDFSTCSPLCGATSKYCISFAPFPGRGSFSTSSNGSRSSNSGVIGIDSSIAVGPRSKKATKSNLLGLEEGVFAPGIDVSIGIPEEDNGHVYKDDGEKWDVWFFWEQNYYLKTTCPEDAAISAYFKSLDGIRAPYQFYWNNCRAFSINTFREVEEKVKKFRNKK